MRSDTAPVNSEKNIIPTNQRTYIRIVLNFGTRKGVCSERWADTTSIVSVTSEFRSTRRNMPRLFQAFQNSQMVLKEDQQNRTHTLRSLRFRKNQSLRFAKKSVCRGRRADSTLMYRMMWEFRKHQATCNVITWILKTLGRSVCGGRTPLQPHGIGCLPF
jgi:hypothetical protein